MLKREFLSTKNLHLSYNQTVYTNTSTPNQKKKKKKETILVHLIQNSAYCK